MDSKIPRFLVVVLSFVINMRVVFWFTWEEAWKDVSWRKCMWKSKTMLAPTWQLVELVFKLPKRFVQFGPRWARQANCRSLWAVRCEVLWSVRGAAVHRAPYGGQWSPTDCCSQMEIKLISQRFTLLEEFNWLIAKLLELYWHAS